MLSVIPLHHHLPGWTHMTFTCSFAPHALHKRLLRREGGAVERNVAVRAARTLGGAEYCPARGPAMDYADKLPPKPAVILMPPRRYMIQPPLTGVQALISLRRYS